MPIYRVTGIDRLSQRDRAAYVKAPDLQSAVGTGARRGIMNAEGVKLDPEDVPEGVPILGAPRRRARPLRERDLLTRPVWTIARGVFVGLLLWTVFAIAVWTVVFGLGQAWRSISG